MQITEAERLILIKKKEEICEATLQIHRLEIDPANSLAIKENIQAILSSISLISSITECKQKELKEICDLAIRIQDSINQYQSLLDERMLQPLILQVYLSIKGTDELWQLRIKDLEYFCSVVNSMEFNFNGKRGVNITFPKNLNVGMNTIL
jgi:hypothetical protein